MKQNTFWTTHSNTRYCGGGNLRRSRRGRKARPLSTKNSLHLVLKTNGYRGLRTPRSFRITREVVSRYSRRFFVKIEHYSIQGDHIHLLIRASRRASYQNFFRVLAGQVAQRVTGTPGRGMRHMAGGMGVTGTPAAHARAVSSVRKRGFWRERPYTRVTIGQKAWRIVRDYIRLNEKEALGEISYRKTRLRGLLAHEWEALW